MFKYFKIFCLIIFIFLLTNNSFANNSNNNIENFINLIKNNDCKGLSKIINYPLARKYPIKSIKNENDFLKNCNVIFDNNFRKKILNSDINNEDDWSEVGYKGIMFDNGKIWLDNDGYVISVNYESDIEIEIREKLLLKDKENLYYTLKNYQENVGIYETKKYIFRLDKLENNSFRYSSWEKNSEMSTKPNIVVNNCNLIYSGSGGNHSYTCKNENYYYTIYFNVIGNKNTPPVELKVYKGNNSKPIYVDSAKLIN